jgi:hypothetical protein
MLGKSTEDMLVRSWMQPEPFLTTWSRSTLMLCLDRGARRGSVSHRLVMANDQPPQAADPSLDLIFFLIALLDFFD